MRLKGSAKRTVTTPGFNITPKYDLKGLRRRLRSGEKKEVNAELPLTSMIDMFSMLVIFLLMNFSTTGEIFFISKDMKLPEASYSKPIESFPLISITKDAVILDAEKMGENPVQLIESDQRLPLLISKLQQFKAFHMAVRPGEPFKGQINIQADQDTPIIYIKRVMAVLVNEGWTGINFAVRLTGVDGGLPDEFSDEEEL